MYGKTIFYPDYRIYRKLLIVNFVVNFRNLFVQN